MRITIGRKLAAGFAFLLLMFIVVGVIFFKLGSHVFWDATTVSQHDLPSAILSFSLRDKVEKMDIDVLEYITGQIKKKQNFETNRQAFLTFFEELERLETGSEQAKMMPKVESLFLDYANTVEKEIFNQYDPSIEQWVKQQLSLIEHQYGEALKKQLEKSAKAELQEIRVATDAKEIVTHHLPKVDFYFVLVEKTGDLMANIAGYVAGEMKEKANFMAHATEFEAAFNQLNALKHKSEKIAALKKIFSLYTQVKNSVEEIFRKYNPQTKKEALATLTRLEHDILLPLENIMEKLATHAKQNVITETNDIILILTEMNYTLFIVILIAIFFGLGISIFLARSISIPLNLLVKGSQRMVVGDMALTGVNQLEIAKITQRKDEIGDIGRAFDAVANYFKEIIEDIVFVSQGLADGNLRIAPKAEYKGDFVQIKNALGAASSDLLLVIQDIVRVSQGLAAGNLRVMPEAKYQGDFTQIKNALETTSPDLQQQVEDIVSVSNGLAKGDLQVIPQAEYKGDFIQIKNALSQALSDLRLVVGDIVQVSQGLAKGNLHVQPQIEYQGDFVQVKNALETALPDLQRVVGDIIRVSQGLAEGNLDVTPEGEYRGDFAQLKTALKTASVKLLEATKKTTTEDWLKTGLAQLNDVMSGEQHKVMLAKHIITFLTTYVDAQVGLFYLLQNEKKHEQKYYLQKDKQAEKFYLKIVASYAYTADKNIPNRFEIGEGLVGQVALEGKTLSRTHTQEEYTQIVQSGLAKAVPRYILIMPLLYENTVKGIIEIGSSLELTKNQQDFLDQALPNIGIAINTAESRSKMQELLEQSQQQTEELQTQSEELQSQQEEMQQINEELQNQREELKHKQEELQNQNEELQNQSEELQTQSEELQTQQEELRQTNEALEERSKDLERQKQEVQHNNLALEKTQHALEFKVQELELASQYKSEFLANMSHELRTPLNSLLILSQLLNENKEGNLSDKQVEYAHTIHDAGSDLLKLINDILDLSKVEAGKMDINTEEVSLPDLVEAMEHKFSPVALNKGLDFRTIIAKDLQIVIHTDSQRLKQIINNLLSNAFKFTSEGEVKLTIQRPSRKEISLIGLNATKTIAISVTDSGIGIPNHKQKLIFDAFQQVDGTTSRRYGGTGLGLSISRQLAQLLGGDIQVSSIEDKGSTFTLYILENLSTSAETSIPQQTEPKLINDDFVVSPEVLTPQSTEIEPLDSLSEEEVIDDRNTLKPEDKPLLIIEDDRKFSTILMELAREQHFKCLLAENGRVGLHLAEEYQPNAIILDAGLPQLDGWTVMDKLKDNPDTRHIPVHFISASDQGLMAKKMGAIGFLRKPVNIEQIGEAFKKIEQFMNQTVKNLLVIVDSEPHQQQILELVNNGDVEVTIAITMDSALQHLKKILFDCIILDMEIEQGAGKQLLGKMDEFEGLCQTPLIIYTNRDLTPAEEALLLQCAERLPIKSVKSPERLLDEATLFLHQLESKLPKEKRNMLKMVHDKEAILKDKKVLIVDDDMRNVFALATVLEDKDMEVVVAQNGKEGLAMLEKHEDIVIILMDIMMPEMDGYEAMQEIRKQRRYHKLPIIALTAKAMKGDKSKCIQAGANDYLSKPVDTDKLISLMRVWLYR
ncbi:response regulator [Candidatus Parabeggiatoa sp. HSG14]|uniref:response regulator n=1 Tax=Candidatus Parabeggiatoa sp. HSG14 TaxID=3055593 RepID=UPI0025A6D354|nr:response regulator [Thiotrichales bacterium HSG14]